MAESIKNKKRNNLSNLGGDASTATQQPLEAPKRRTLSGWPMIIGWLAMLIFALHSSTHMVGAGDTWVAMACGRHFVNHGVDTVEPFSANSHKAGPTPEEIKTWPKWAQWITDKVGLETVRYWHPTGWINQNWLTHVIFYSLIPKSSYADGISFPSNALVYWKFALYILTVICVYYTGRLLGAHPALCAVFACFAMFVGRSLLDVRPAGFSNLLVAVFLFILVLATYRNTLYIWLIIPLTVFWCNVHGGYIYAFIMLVPFVTWHLLMMLPKRWRVSVFSILFWVVLYAMAYKFFKHELLSPIQPDSDWIFYLLFILVVVSLAIAAYKKVKNETFYAYHIVASFIIFFSLLPRFFPTIPLNLHPQQQKILSIFVNGSRWSFIAFFILLMGLGLLLMFLKNKLVCMKLKGIYHTIAAGFVAFLAVILFNPFHLTNLTHTFVISVSKHAERWRDVNEWHRAFEWDNPVGDEIPFLIMYIIAWLVLLIWAVVILILTSRFFSRLPKRRVKSSEAYQWPHIDIALMSVAAMTIYMAICSRRFIPVAAIATCPIIAMFIDQMVCSISARSNFHEKKRLFVSPMPKILQWICTSLGIWVILGFGIGWGLKFKRVYLDAWPTDTKLNSVFMRMTASDAKPFYALKFIKDNKLEGKMFNYWTEGGFIAWGQEPDPNTGRTPLQLFMDGRAQAAYQRRAYEVWSAIISGGPIVRDAKFRRRKLTAADYVDIGKWVDQQLRNRNVWVVLMPSAAYIDPRKGPYHFVKGLEHNSNWPIVFYNNKQKLFVDVRTPRGKELFEGIENGNTLYPDDFSRKLTLAHIKLLIALQLENQTRQLENVRKATRATLDNDNNILKAREKAAAQFTENLNKLSEQLRNVQERLKVAKEKEQPGLEELEKQKQLIEKEIKTVKAKLDSENTIIKVKEKTLARIRQKLTDLSAQLAIIQSRLKDAKNQGLEHAIEAFGINQSQTPMQEIVYVASKFADLIPRINDFCKNYFDEFTKNKADYAKEDGYFNRTVAALNAGSYLHTIAKRQKNTKDLQFYAVKMIEYKKEQQRLLKRKRW